MCRWKMTSRPDITQRENMLEIQGDRVVAYKRVDEGLKQVWVLTLVHVVDEDAHSMGLSNREDKTRQPDWPFTQAYYDRLRPAVDAKTGAKWAITLKL